MARRKMHGRMGRKGKGRSAVRTTMNDPMRAMKRGRSKSR